jgi:hypothetical protein
VDAEDDRANGSCAGARRVNFALADDEGLASAIDAVRETFLDMDGGAFDDRRIPRPGGNVWARLIPRESRRLTGSLQDQALIQVRL